MFKAADDPFFVQVRHQLEVYVNLPITLDLARSYTVAAVVLPSLRQMAHSGSSRAGLAVASATAPSCASAARSCLTCRKARKPERSAGGDTDYMQFF